MIKRFFYYPFPRKRALLYTDRDVLRSELFRALDCKLFPENPPVLKLRRGACASLAEVLFRKHCDVPAAEVSLIYLGYESNVYFALDAAGCPARVWRERDAAVKEEAVLGMPVFFDPAAGEPDSILKLKEFLRQHWINLRAGGSLHGDLTHFNILLSQQGVVSAIDQRPPLQTASLSDHFYFYAYLLRAVRRYRPASDARHEQVKAVLDGLMKSVFSYESPEYLREQLTLVKPELFPVSMEETALESFSSAVLPETAR